MCGGLTNNIANDDNDDFCKNNNNQDLKTNNSQSFKTDSISGKPRCTGLFAWVDNHMRAVQLYRESIEATQVAARCAHNVVMFGSTISKRYHFLQEDMKSGIDANGIGPNLWSALCTIYFFHRIRDGINQ